MGPYRRTVNDHKQGEQGVQDAARVAVSEASAGEEPVTGSGLLLTDGDVTEVPLPGGTLIVAYRAHEGA